MNVILVAGARPNFMKIAPILRAIRAHNRRRPAGAERLNPLLVHTGQHYDESMSKRFFADLGLPEPDINLGVGSASHGRQTAMILDAFEQVCLDRKPDRVLVVGDVNSTLACSLAAAKLNIAVDHVEAGLRSFDRSMPEEINRIVTDHLADGLFTPTRDAGRNLAGEGIPRSRIHFVGNVMADSLLANLGRARRSPILENLGLKRCAAVKPYALATLHRPANVDDSGILGGILRAFREIAQVVPVLFPAHPRTMKQVRRFKMSRLLRSIRVLPPLGYLDFLALMARASVLLTDSGGIQEEAMILGKPCLTLRDITERPVTLLGGGNRLVGHDPEAIVAAAFGAVQRGAPRKRTPEYWDGKAAERIVDIVAGG
jgi:UDP-N-acetylglucosamine 2-epimerase (non-hydrolysing)